jgi:myo-inositol-1(or 4)-monophosphatase
MDLDKALGTARLAAKEARKVLLHYFGRLSKVREKGDESLVSEADEESEKTILNIVRKDFPEIPMLGEEAASKGKWELPETAWIVDPLDGTTNYVHGFSIFNISIGLRYKGELVVGVVDVPLLNQTFWATKGGGAFLNGEKIEVSKRAHLKEALLATGFYPHHRVDLAEQMKIFGDLVPDARGVRRAGAAAYDLCMVAQGVFDAFWEKNLKPWDTAAGTLLVREAGGKVVNYSGGDHDVGDAGMLASNEVLSASLYARLAKAIEQR